MSYYRKKFDLADYKLLVIDELAGELLSMQLFPGMTMNQLKYVTSRLKELCPNRDELWALFHRLIKSVFIQNISRKNGSICG